MCGGDTGDDSSYDSYMNEFFTKNQLAGMQKIPSFFAVGNHECWEQNTQAFRENPRISGVEQSYYSFDYGDVHFLVLDTEESAEIGSPMYNFALQDLKTSTKPWKIVIGHKTIWASDEAVDDPNLEVIANNIFKPYNVSAYICGHRHNFERYWVNGLHEFVVGSGGAIIDPFTEAVGPYGYVTGAESYSYLTCDVTPTSLHFVVYDENNNVLDTLDLPSSESPIVKPMHVYEEISSPPVGPNGTIDIAKNGTGYTWCDNTDKTDNKNQVAAPAVNDGTIRVAKCSDNEIDRWDAAGVMFKSNQDNISRVDFINGDCEEGDGYFTDDCSLQFTTDGEIWTDSDWEISPKYTNDETACGKTYTFKGSVKRNIKGVRVVGKVHPNDDSSWGFFFKEMYVWQKA